MEIVAALGEVQPVCVEPVPPEQQAAWDATVAAHHALGFQRAFGAHQRYWIYVTVDGQRVIVGALLFAAAARNVAVRDRYLGWTAQQQQRRRHLIVANSRFLILPGVRVPHLASHALSLGLRRVRDDWQGRFGYTPVAVETFVTPPWRGTCYRAANWVHLGQTTGRGRQDRDDAQGGTVRDVFVRPMVRNWRRVLREEEVATGLPAQRLGGGEQQRSAPDRGGVGMITADQALNERAERRMQQRFAAMAPFLDEKQRRLLAGAEAIAYGAGGQERVATLLGISKITVGRGMRELQHPETVQRHRVRKPGGGRKRATDLDPELRTDLDPLVSPDTRGDPQSPLRWTCKSTRHLAEELHAAKAGRAVSDHLVRNLLHDTGYSLQAVRKVREGTQHPDRDAQFQYINAIVQDFQQRGQPVISVDTKKKELVGDFKNAGREWQPKGQPETARVHDFLIPELGKVSPYGVYRSHPQRGVGQRCHRSRHRCLRRRQYPRLVAQHGPTCVSGRHRANRHRRRWREQQLPFPALEGRTAEVGRRPRTAHRRLPLPARHQQVEQGRAPAVLSHHSEPARAAPDQPRCHRQPDRRHHDQLWPEAEAPARHQPLPRGHQGLRRRTQRHPHRTLSVSRRVELPSPAAVSKITCFVAVPYGSRVRVYRTA
jgi:hypothetical protein